jgi:hypothetical protein
MLLTYTKRIFHNTNRATAWVAKWSRMICLKNKHENVPIGDRTQGFWPTVQINVRQRCNTISSQEIFLRHPLVSV